MKIPVIIKDVNRLPNSINGNPQYKLITNNGVVITPEDSILGYKHNFDSFIGEDVFIEYEFNNNSQAVLISIEKTDFGGFLQDLEG